MIFLLLIDLLAVYIFLGLVVCHYALFRAFVEGLKLKRVPYPFLEVFPALVTLILLWPDFLYWEFKKSK